ncbi:sugar kinase [Fulvitalea axinellae]|uniref:Sugar kinase n=2 Tax=Fulvitalea axinellae TaxID=1182444 RepID=A0AAU9C8Q0_9BACT|nr:sugar kinase [Fulvitalea axinellae]
MPENIIMSLLAIGTVAFDALETPFGKVDKIIGGSCTYIALAASYFTGKVNISAVVGDDFPNEEIGMLNKHGVDTEGLQVKEGQKSFFWSGRYHNDMNTRDTLVTELNVLEDFDPVIPENYQDCKYLMLGNLTPQVQQTVIDRISERPKFIAMDTMNLWIDIARADLDKVLSNVDLLLVNDEEARQMTGEYSLPKAAKAIMDCGPKYLIIKKGEHGALLFGEGKTFYAPALPLEEVFDPTGAGDTFAGGFMGYLAKTDDISFENMKKALIYGSALASFCVEQFGPEKLKALTQEQIDGRVQEFVELTDFGKNL